MITNITTDTATIILPITDIDFPTLERLNRNLGAYVIHNPTLSLTLTTV